MKKALIIASLVTLGFSEQVTFKQRPYLVDVPQT
jgi:hypothetical protein